MLLRFGDYLYCAVATVGLEETVYTVVEGAAESVTVCAVVHSPVIECPISSPFIVTLSTQDSTAGYIVLLRCS